MKYLILKGTDIVKPELIRDWGIDALITEDELSIDLSNIPSNNEPNTIFVSTIFDNNNALSYDGANLALRILMHNLRNDIFDTDIVLLGYESEENFLLHYDYPNILKIPGIYYSRFNKNAVSKYTNSKRETLKATEYQYFLNNLGLKIPSSFKSTHSLTNEWCLFKWNTFTGIEDSPTRLFGHLYFEYLITLEKIQKTKNKEITDHLKERIQKLPHARILLIDDNAGWHLFFKTMFVNNTDINIQCLGDNFNKLPFNEIKRIIEDKINDFNPHIIILDYRLMEDKDAEIKDNMKQISGYKILAESIKGNYIHPLPSFGRQVLIFTATSRIENILMLREGNADGFILKEKPHNYNGKEITKQVISKMIATIETAINRANVLIPLNESLRELETLNVSSLAELKERINIVLESVRLITQTNSLNEGTLKLTYLNLFSILESLKPSHIKYLDSYVQENAPNLILRYWNNIDKVRNSLAHGDRIVKIDGKELQISVAIIQEWQIKLCDFIKEFIAHQQSNNK